MYYRCIIRGYYGIDGRGRFRYSIHNYSGENQHGGGRHLKF